MCDHNNCNGCCSGGFSSLMFGLALGFGAGAVVGMLYAPKKGTELQKDWKKKLDQATDKLKNVKEEASPKLQEMFGKVSSEINDLYEDVKEDISKAASSSKEKVTKEKFEEMVDKIVAGHKKKKDKYADRLDKIGEEFKGAWGELKEIFPKS